jgi:hypothetical protein
MAIGNTLPMVLVQGLTNSVSGLGTYISSYFAPTTEPQEYRSNSAWNDPINGDSNGLFRVYHQNVHGIPRDDVALAQDLQALAEFDIGCFCLLETNLDCQRPYVRSDFLSRQRKTWKHAATSFSSIAMESSSDYMTGGTLT